MEEIYTKVNIGKSIKSNYILQEIFSFTDEHIKLLIIQYNKLIQSKLEVNIENYKEMSTKYIEGEKNGIGKEYSTIPYGKLIFEGEYKNGKKNGKGKEYYRNGEIKFEGEYKNGKKMEKEKNIIKMVMLNLKENIKAEKD